jgi:hypothetical protein
MQELKIWLVTSQLDDQAALNAELIKSIFSQLEDQAALILIKFSKHADMQL